MYLINYVQLEEFFRGIPEVLPATMGRLLLDISNTDAGIVLPKVLANIGLTPVCFFHARGSQQRHVGQLASRG
jgi:hypothetical protein